MKYDCVFWDWNGTILDDVNESIAAVNRSLAKRNLPSVDMEKYDRMFCFPVIEYYKKLGFDFTKESYDVLANEFINNYIELAATATVHSGAVSVIKKLNKLNVSQYVLSASEKNILCNGLKKYGIEEYFKDIIALDNVYAGGKAEIAKIWLNNHENIGKAVMIGDTEHDFEVAEALGIDCILVCCGHSSREKLEKFGVPVFDDFEDVFKYLFGILHNKKLYGGGFLGSEEMRNYDIREAKKQTLHDFTTVYKAFYDDVKNSPKTEDW